MIPLDVRPPIRKNSREEIRIGLQSYNGVDLASIRVWFDAADGTKRPGRDGINFRVELLPKVAEAVNAALEAARERGLLDK